MSRYRNIYCQIWNDDKFPFSSDDCKLVMFHIFTTPLSTPFGLFKASLGSLADEMRWPTEKYEKAFQEAVAKGFIKYNNKYYVIHICNYLRYNPPANPNVLKGWAKIYSEIPQCDLKNTFYQILKGLVKGFHEGFQQAFVEAWGRPIVIQEQYQEQKQYQKKKKKQYLQECEECKEEKETKDSPLSKRRLSLEYVHLTENEYQKLIDIFGTDDTHKGMMALNEYIRAKGEARVNFEFKSHYTAIRELIKGRNNGKYV